MAYNVPPHFHAFYSAPPPPIFPLFNVPPPTLPQEIESNLQETPLDNFIKSIPIQTHKKDTKINITKVKNVLADYLNTINQLERSVAFMQATKQTLDEVEWKLKCTEVEEKMIKLNEIYDKLDDPVFIKSAEAVIKKRQKKRASQKIQKNRWKEYKQETKSFREREHRRIDLWLEKMKDEVERAQREETVTREADIVLSDVTFKKNEAKRTLSMLNTLAKLRNARSLQVKQATSDDSFNKVIDNLKSLWINQLNGYNREEQCLRVMLNDAEVERVNVQTSEYKKVLMQWKEVLFGKKTDTDYLPKSLDELISVRITWDKFVASDSAGVVASSIPPGWVVPCKPSNNNWAEYLLN